MEEKNERRESRRKKGRKRVGRKGKRRNFGFYKLMV